MPGRNTSNKLLLAAGLCGLSAIAGCKPETAKPAPQPPAVTIAQPFSRQVQDYNEYTGRTAAIESVDIRAKVRGFLDKIDFTDGQMVKAGQVLFEIDPRPFEVALKAAEGQLGQVTARKAKAEADVKRYTDLVPKGAATQQDLDKAIAELGEAVAGIQSAQAEVDRAKLDLTYAKVTSPIDGLTSRAMLSVGNLTGAGSGTDDVLTTVVKVDPIQVYFEVDERAAQVYARQTSKVQPERMRDLKIPVEVGLAGGEGYPYQGVLDFANNKVDPGTGTITGRAELPNSVRVFKPGYFTRVRMPAGPPYDAVLVADRAIGTQQGQKYVLVVNDKNTVVFRPVKLGSLQPGGLRVVREGLTADEWVVVNGMQKARPDAQVAPDKSQMPLHEAGDAMPATQPAATQPAAVPAAAAKQ